MVTVFMSDRYLIIVLRQSEYSSFQVLSALKKHLRGIDSTTINQAQEYVKGSYARLRIK